MSSGNTTQSDSSTLTEEELDGMNEKQREIASHLVKEVEKDDSGYLYTRSKKIAQALGLSSKEVGVNLAKISDEISILNVNKWAQSNSSTWRIESNFEDEDE